MTRQNTPYKNVLCKMYDVLGTLKSISFFPQVLKYLLLKKQQHFE